MQGCVCEINTICKICEQYIHVTGIVPFAGQLFNNHPAKWTIPNFFHKTKHKLLPVPIRIPKIETLDGFNLNTCKY